MTLNGEMAVILRYLNEFDSLGANYVTVVNTRLTLSARKRSAKNLVFGNITRPSQ